MADKAPSAWWGSAGRVGSEMGRREDESQSAHHLTPQKPKLGHRGVCSPSTCCRRHVNPHGGDQEKDPCGRGNGQSVPKMMKSLFRFGGFFSVNRQGAGGMAETGRWFGVVSVCVVLLSCGDHMGVV